jgi:PAS domain S-box-containing protein
MYSIAGLDPEDFYGNLQDTINKGIHPDDRESVHKQIAEMIEQKRTWPMEFRFVRQDGTVRVLRSGSRFIFDDAGRPIICIGVHQDITEQKEAEEEQNLNEARLEGLLKLHDMGGTDLDKLALFVLEESERLTRSEIGFINFLSEDESEVTRAVYTASTLRQCKLPENVSAFKISECGLWSEAYRLRRPIVVNDYSMDYASKVGFPEGHPTLRRFISIPIFDGENIVAVAALGNKKSDYNQADVRQFRLFMEGMWRILKQKQAESELRRTIKEKDFLLEEINHRVKNNLAIISSLIHLKDTALGKSVDLSDITNQINAIALVHEKLYKSESITNINLSEYIEEMLATIFSSFTKNHVAIKNTIGEIVLPTKSAVTLGLIINEVATNAIKHGFTSDVQPEFTVSMEDDTQNGQYVLTLSNSGNPFPEDIDLDHPTTLGLRLISALVGQLKGTIELVRKPSPEFTIRFPAGKKQ